MFKKIIFAGLAFIAVSCSKNDDAPFDDGNQKVASNVSEPQLLSTLPASWDENWFSRV